MKTTSANRQHGSRKRGRSIKTFSKGKARLLIGLMGGIAGLLLWYGLVIEVQCGRLDNGRVDITVNRRFCGLITLSSTKVMDVVKADVYYVLGTKSAGVRGTRGFSESIELTSREGQVLRRNRFGPSFGTKPKVMAANINQFISSSSETSLKIWWMPWLVNLAAIPFVLLVGGIVGEVILRKIGVVKDT